MMRFFLNNVSSLQSCPDAPVLVGKALVPRQKWQLQAGWLGVTAEISRRRVCGTKQGGGGGIMRAQRVYRFLKA